MDERLARCYRQARREEWNGQPTTPAKWAMVRARAHIRGSELIGASEDDTWHGSYARRWREDIGPDCWVDVWQVSDDDEQCDCWEEEKDAARECGREPVDIPSHGHFGIVTDIHHASGDVTHDALWGFVWDWPGQDDDAELAYAWGEVADYAISDARRLYAEHQYAAAVNWASLPQWVRDAVLIRGEEWETYPPKQQEVIA